MKMKKIHYISYFIQIFHISNHKDPCNENNVNITYQVMGRQQITQSIIHENLSRKIYSSIYLIISMNNVRETEYEIIIYETIHIPTRGE